MWTLLAYFLVLLGIGALTGRGGGNEGFFSARRRSPWLMVALGMVGASISGVSFISVPGMAQTSSMTYLQMCLGFIPGYFIVASVLLPVFYSLGKPTIYSYLEQRLGPVSYRTGAGFFMLSKMGGTAVKFYVVCMILQQRVAAGLGVPFPATVCLLVLLVWLYTRRGGMKTLVWTDVFQTFAMFGALVLIIFKVAGSLGMDMGEAVRAVAGDPRSRIFVFDDPMSRQYFWKQFISGILIVVVMTGLDQDMMQKNLTCKTLKDAKKDMCTYGVLFVPANLLLLSLGILLIRLSGTEGLELPENTDSLVPMFAAGGRLGTTVTVLFTIGIVAACFSSADSALTSMTTSFCLDFLGRDDDAKTRKIVHGAMAIVLAGCILVFGAVKSKSLLDTVYTIVSYTYGPLLGLFAFGLLTRRQVCDKAVPIIAIAAPVICFITDAAIFRATNYQCGYEILLLNGLLTFTGLVLTGKPTRQGPRREARQ